MDPIQAVNRAEAERSLAIATKLLAARDLVGSKRFAEMALEADPRLSDERADQILAVADVLLASQKRINNHLDWYSILQLPHPPPSPNSNSNSPNSTPNFLLKSHYRRLSLLLHPDRNRFPGADAAFKLVVDAHNVLSDPAKRSLFDAELRISDNLSGGSSSAAAGADGEAASFWTLCPSCCHAHQYGRAYLNKTLRCQTCRGAFTASELQALPTVVPGTDMYYATWGFFPLGFANPGSTDWKPFVSVYPSGGGGPHQSQNQNQNPPQAGGPASGGGGHGSAEQEGRNKKKTARKKVMGRPKSRMFGNWVDFGDANATDSKEDDDDVAEGKEEEARGININEAAKGIGEDDIDMIIDLDATDDMLGNLPNLPSFLKDDGINLHIGGF